MEDANTLLMSDSLKGMVPELEGASQEKNSDFSIIYAILGLYSKDYSNPLAGRVVGVSFEKSQEIKVDVRIKALEAYDFIKKIKTTRLSCGMLYLYLGDDEICFDGPYEVSCPRIFDMDLQNKMCTLGVDLIKS